MPDYNDVRELRMAVAVAITALEDDNTLDPPAVAAIVRRLKQCVTGAKRADDMYARLSAVRAR